MVTERVVLPDMRVGESGRIAEVLGGRGIHGRLSSLGIRFGVVITLVSPVFSPGPIVLQVGGAQVALGFGMSRKIIVEVQR